MKKEWVKGYHTPTVGTTYHIKVESGYIELEAIEKPYKLRGVSIEELEKLLEQHTTH